MRLVGISEAWLDTVLTDALSALSDLRPSLPGSSTFIIEGNLAVEVPRSTGYRAQARGPPSGPAVVTASAVELFSIELRVEKNH
jgi:hypothetical protein